jgi:hypothetical protein
VTFFVAVVFLFFYQQELQGLLMALDAPLQLLECLKHTAVTAIHQLVFGLQFCSAAIDQ